MHAEGSRNERLATAILHGFDPPTVYIVDTDDAARGALSRLVESAGWHTECFSSAEEFLAQPRRLQPGCLLLDVALPRLDGLGLQQLVADRQEIAVVFLTHRCDVQTAVQAMKAGAVDFLAKPPRMPAVIDAIRSAFDRSQRALGEEASMRALKECYVQLTRREREVMEQVIAGRLNKQIAADLGTSEITVKVHRCNMKRKMKADSLAALVRMATRLGLHVGAGRVMS
jgi:FixJ family two-component response regulator